MSKKEALVSASRQNIANSFDNESGGPARERSKVFTHQPLVNGYDFGKFYERGVEKMRFLAFAFFESVFVPTNLCFIGKNGGNRYGNNILLGAVKGVGGYNEGGTIFNRRQIGEGKWNQYNISGFIGSCRHRRMDCSKNQTMVQIVSETPSLLRQCPRDTANAPKIAAVFPALLSGFPLQFSLMKVLSPLNSIVAKLKKLSNSIDESAPSDTMPVNEESS